MVIVAMTDFTDPKLTPATQCQYICIDIGVYAAYAKKMNLTTIKTEQLQIRVSPEQKAYLKAAAAAANMSVSEYVLSALFSRNEEQFQTFISRLAQGENHKLVLAELNDFLTELAPVTFLTCVSSPPRMQLSPFLANYVSAMVEVAAHQKYARPPQWTRDIPPLAQPYFGASLKNLRLYLLTHSPPPFRRRNIFIDASIGERI